jgi:hypothetical protein
MVRDVGVLSAIHFYILTRVFRCDADPTDLDGSPAELRTLSQFLTLLDTEDEDSLWFGHGIVPDFLVRPALQQISSQLTINSSHSPLDFHAQIYTSFSPQISSIRPSKERSKTTLLHGLKITLSWSTAHLGG